MFRLHCVGYKEFSKTELKTEKICSAKISFEDFNISFEILSKDVALLLSNVDTDCKNSALVILGSSSEERLSQFSSIYSDRLLSLSGGTGGPKRFLKWECHSDGGTKEESLLKKLVKRNL